MPSSVGEFEIRAFYGREIVILRHGRKGKKPGRSFVFFGHSIFVLGELQGIEYYVFCGMKQRIDYNDVTCGSFQVHLHIAPTHAQALAHASTHPPTYIHDERRADR